MRWQLLVSVLALGAMTAVGTWLGPAAHADKIKDCGTTTEAATKPNPKWTDTTTETQIAACNSASDTGEETETITTNPQGKPSPGQNK